MGLACQLHVGCHLRCCNIIVRREYRLLVAMTQYYCWYRAYWLAGAVSPCYCLRYPCWLMRMYGVRMLLLQVGILVVTCAVRRLLIASCLLNVGCGVAASLLASSSYAVATVTLSPLPMSTSALPVTTAAGCAAFCAVCNFVDLLTSGNVDRHTTICVCRYSEHDSAPPHLRKTVDRQMSPTKMIRNQQTLTLRYFLRLSQVFARPLLHLKPANSQKKTA
jgi:hypothetical protein